MAKAFTINDNPQAHIRSLLDYMATGVAPNVPGDAVRALKAFHKRSGENPADMWIPRDMSAEDFQAAQRDRAHWVWKTGEEVARAARRELATPYHDVVADEDQKASLHKAAVDFLQAAKAVDIPALTIADHLPSLCRDELPMIASALVFLGGHPRSENGLELARKLVRLRYAVTRSGLLKYADLQAVLNSALETCHGPDVKVPRTDSFPNRDVRLMIARRGGGESREHADIQLRPVVAEMYAAIMGSEIDWPSHSNNEEQGTVVGSLVMAILVMMPWANEDRDVWIPKALRIAARILAAPKTYLAASERGPREQLHQGRILAGVLDMATQTAPVGARLPIASEILTAAGLLGICLGSNWWLSRDVHQRISDVVDQLFGMAGVLRKDRDDLISLGDDLFTILGILYPGSWWGTADMLTDVMSAYAER